jgi:hypothetical protein
MIFVVGSFDPKLQIDLVVDAVVAIVPQVPTKLFGYAQVVADEFENIVGLQESGSHSLPDCLHFYSIIHLHKKTTKPLQSE